MMLSQTLEIRIPTFFFLIKKRTIKSPPIALQSFNMLFFLTHLEIKIFVLFVNKY